MIVTEYSYLGITFNSNWEVSKFPNNYLQRKREDQYLVQNVFLNFTSFQLLYAINFLMPYFFPYHDTALRYGVLIIIIIIRNRKKTPLKNLKNFTPNFTNILLA